MAGAFGWLAAALATPHLGLSQRVYAVVLRVRRCRSIELASDYGVVNSRVNSVGASQALPNSYQLKVKLISGTQILKGLHSPAQSRVAYPGLRLRLG